MLTLEYAFPVTQPVQFILPHTYTQQPERTPVWAATTMPLTGPNERSLWVQQVKLCLADYAAENNRAHWGYIMFPAKKAVVQWL